LSGIVIQ